MLGYLHSADFNPFEYSFEEIREGSVECRGVLNILEW